MRRQATIAERPRVSRASSHLPATLRRRIQAAGFSTEPPQVCPVLNSEFDPDTYSVRHIAIVSEFVQQHSIDSQDTATWARDLHERAEAAEYFFSLNRYLFTGHKR